jgi:dihydroflavonol-4-reductase
MLRSKACRIAMRALVLGATGFIGGQIACAALTAGYRVRALRRRNVFGALTNVAQAIEWVLGDLADVDALSAAARGCDVMFHAAAHYPQSSRDIAGEVAYAEAQMERVLEAAQRAGVTRMIYTSSLTTVGPPSEPCRLADERDIYTPGSSGSAYYEAKYAMEQMALRAAADGLAVVILLPSAVFGPGDVKPTTGQALVEVAKGRMPVYFDTVINVVDGRDVAAAHIAAVEHGRIGHRYIIGGHNLTLRRMLNIAAEAAGVAPPRLKLPQLVVDAVIRLSDALPGVQLPENGRTLRFWQPLSTLKAERELGLSARPFELTATDTIVWFRQHGYLCD